jgi:hypothetical protein
MTTAMTKRLARAVLIAGLALPTTALLPASAPFAISKAHAEATTMAQFKSILASFGTFAMHDKYGEIWVPGVTPPGWHPYPACQWVYTKQGWYFNDKTPWGAIVHHYGRWSHDEKVGWFWVPDQDWSPGWVAWRKSDAWVGWAPLPPQQDIQLVSSAEFNNDKDWIFMDAQKFLNGECGDTVRAGDAFYQTQPVNIFGLSAGLLVDIDFHPHWTSKVIIELVDIDIDIDIDINYCPPTQPNPPRRALSSPIHFPNDPGPKNTSNNPPPNRTVGDPPIRTLGNNPTLNTGVIDLPLHPGGRVGKVGGNDTPIGRHHPGRDTGGRVSDGGSGSNSKPSFTRTLHPLGTRFSSTGLTGSALKPSFASGPRTNGLATGGKGFSIR